MVDIINKELCSGCGACSNICPQKCIKMTRDEEGFRYPVIDYNKCTKCNLCSKICPFNNLKENLEESLVVYGAVNKNGDTLKNSSSGGVFKEIAKYIINKNGVVFGAVYDENINVIHSSIEKEEEINKMQGSKYVESDTKNVFEEVKKKLKEDRLVLFSGTPCQIAGLNNYLNKNYDNLITCDFICQGIPTPKIFDAYKNHYKKKYKSEITNVQFRNKKDGWVHFNMVFTFENGKKKYISRYKNPYTKAHYNMEIVRPSCYKCPFRKLNSESDIKLADFWRIAEINPKYYNFYGVSHILINTEKGNQIFEKIKHNFNLYNSSYEEVKKLNGSFSELKLDKSKRDPLMKNIRNLTDEEIIININKLYNNTSIQNLKISIRVKLAKVKYTILKRK